MKTLVAVAILIGGTLILGVLLFAGQYFATLREREIHLIPAGYRGPVVIAYDRADGQPVRREDGARVFEIPSNGILRTQMERPGDGWVRPGMIRYFYVDEHGNREEIPEAQHRNAMIDEMKIYIFGRHLGNTGGAANAGTYESYVVGTIHEHNDSVSIAQHEMTMKATEVEDTEPVMEIYVLPKGYQGPVAVFFNRPDGAPEKYQGAVRVFEIPADGILHTQLSPPAGKDIGRDNARRFYYVDEEDTTELAQVKFSTAVPDSVNVYVRGGGVMELEKSGQKVTRYMVGTSNMLSEGITVLGVVRNQKIREAALAYRRRASRFAKQ